jgi:hypothetical protein
MIVVHSAEVSILYPRVVISSLAKPTTRVWPRDHYMLLQRPTTGVCHALLRILTQCGPACSAEVSHIRWPLLHHVVQAVHKECHIDGSHPHSTEHDTLPVAYQISKQVIPYRTRGGTCYPGGSTPKIRSLADLSMTSQIT